jgi:HptB-dependent secretion and biofilm anti anti-sigma factor
LVTRTRDTSGASLVHLSGRFDFSCFRDFHQAIGDGAGDWVIDLGDVDYVDSSALGMLLLLRDRTGGDGKRIRLRGAHGQPYEVLKVAKFDVLFRFE